jgi:hypothetical protein
MKLFLLAVIAFVWFFVLPFYDMFFKQSHSNDSMMHWFSSSSWGSIVGVIGCLCLLAAMLSATLQFLYFLARLFTKKPRQ